MEFQGMETSVIDVLRAKELQRLRRIRQLGLGHFVFPGAEHSRLAHSLGAAYLAVRFVRHLQRTTREFLIDQLSPTDTSVRDLAVAALCHDLGHGPLSHVWERHVIGENFNRRAWSRSLGLEIPHQDLSRLKWHELVGQALLAWPDGELHRILETQELNSSDRIRQLLMGRYYIPYLPRLLSSDVDVDRSDFLLRDAHQTGVAYGRFDLNWLISTATVGTTSDGRLTVGFDLLKAPPVIEQFLVARRAMYHTVYLHKTVRAAEAMVSLLLGRLGRVLAEKDLGINDPLFVPFKKIIRREPLSPDEILGLDDYSLWVFIQRIAEAEAVDLTSADLARRIVARDLFKIVPCDSTRLRDYMFQPEAYERIHEILRSYARGDPESYVYVDHSPVEMLSSDEHGWAYFVDTDTRIAQPVRDHPRILQYARQPETIVRIFAPREAIEEIAKLINAPD
jgi:HD superfamily phosphohydrolase